MNKSQIITMLSSLLDRIKEPKMLLDVVKNEDRRKVLVVAITSIGVLYIVVKRITRKKKINLKGPKGYPLIGPAIDLENPQRTITKWHIEYGKNFYFRSLGRDMFVISDFNIIKQIMDDRTHFPMPPAFREAITFRSGWTMFTSEGDMWKKRHRVLEPLLHAKMMKHHFGVITEKLTKFIRILESSSGAVNIGPLLHRLTQDVIGGAAFGTDFETLENPDKLYSDRSGKVQVQLSRMFSEVLTAINLRIMLPFKWFWRLPLAVFRREDELSSVLDNLFHDAIDKHAKRKDTNTSVHEANDLISQLIASSDNADEKNYKYQYHEMLSECFSIFGAGHDTTATEALFLIMELANNPDIQEKIRNEIKSIAQTDHRNFMPTFEDLNKMKYIDNVIKEALRLHPVAPTLFREAMEDMEINGIQIPKGAVVWLDLQTHQHDPELFPNPDKVVPERWDVERPPTLLAFGYGQRACFGKRFALMELKMLVFYLMRNFKVSLASDKPINIVNNFGLRPENDDLFVKFERVQ